MQPLGVHHVSIMVEDVAAAVQFYTGTLGLTIRDDRPEFGIGGAWLDAGAQQLHLVEGRPPTQAGQHFALLVGDLDGLIADLRAAGHDVRDPFATPVSKQTTISDPAGNLVELHQRL